jgi:alpha-galactosidase/6-phospho-beta-glucosidase family protein
MATRYHKTAKIHHNYRLAVSTVFSEALGMSLKITLIGAGSVVFAKNLIGDILQFPELSDATICLMDIDPQRLKIAELMTRRMIEALGVKAKVVGTLDRRTAIKGARYVICTVQVGGYKPGTVIDFEIPRKYGLLQTIGDTLGIGGIFRALRTIPVLTEIARDIAEVGAPDCLLLNYTNPMAMLCNAVHKTTGIPHVGLCHSVQGTSQQLASFLGLPYSDITYLVAGINHMAFFLKFDYRGQDAYPLLFQLLEKPGFDKEKVRFEMMRRTGYFVTESSEHQSEYVPYFIHHGKKVIEQFDVPIDEYLRRCESGLRTWKQTEANLLGKDGRMIVAPQSHEYGSFIIHSRETNTPRVIYGNVPNTGLIENLPMDACVELPCLIDGQGIQPTHIGMLPPQLAALCQTNINVQELTVEAALTGQREHIYHAAMLDPHTATVLTLDKIWAMCDDLIAEHQKHGLLGEFAPTIPNTGRAYKGTGDRVQAEVTVNAPKKATDKLEAEVVVTNPRTTPFVASLAVDAVTLDAVTGSGNAIAMKIKVPAKKSVRKKVLLGQPPLGKGLAVRLSAASPELLTRDFVMPERRILGGAGKKEGTPFDLTLAGFPAAEGTIALRKQSIALRVAVDDTKIQPSSNPWEGSVVELFFSDVRNGNICQWFIVPQQGGRSVRVVDPHFKKSSTIRARIGPAPVGSGYEINVEIPWVAAGLSPNAKNILFDTIVRLTALGDAHSGGRASLSGGYDSNHDSSGFVQVNAE